MSEIPSTSADFLPDIVVARDRKTPRQSSSSSGTSTVLPSKCSICSQPAVGFHYDVASCNGCKAFFRRTVITGRRYTCTLFKRCLDGTSSSSNKRICGACRFAKCEEMGMNPMSIQAELLSDQGKLMKAEILKRRQKNEQASRIKLQTQMMNVEDELSSAIRKLTLAENQMEILHNSNLPEYYGDLRPLPDILSSAPVFDAEKIPNLYYMHDKLYPAHAGFAHNSLLSIVEHAKLLDFFGLLSIETVRKVINQGAVICRNMIMSYHSIQKFNSDIIRRPDGTIAGKPMRNYNGVWVEHRKIIQKTLHAFLRNMLDYVEYMLLKVIVLCNPAIPGLPIADQEVLENERIRHARCLLTYCFRQHGKLQGPSRYASILSMVSIMEQQQREQKSFHVVLRAFHRDAQFFVSPLYDEIMESS